MKVKFRTWVMLEGLEVNIILLDPYKTIVKLINPKIGEVFMMVHLVVVDF